MKKYYQPPTLCSVSVDAHGHLLDGASSFDQVSSSDVGYDGGSSQNGRVKENGYNVWDDDWSTEDDWGK